MSLLDYYSPQQPALTGLSVCIIFGLLCHPLRVPVSQGCHMELLWTSFLWKWARPLLEAGVSA